MKRVKNISLANSELALTVIERLRSVLETYGVATVEDLYDLVDIPPTFEDEKIGWTNLDEIEVMANLENECVILILPEPTPLRGGLTKPFLPPKLPTMDELIKSKASELRAIYNNRTAGDKTFEGFLFDYTKIAINLVATELVSDFVFGKEKS